jgi:hypothetical protein
MHRLPREIILALVLIDLPINLDDTEGAHFRDDFGASWWYLTCDCDDHYTDIVEEVLSLCSFIQTRALSYFRFDLAQNDVLLTRASPKCKEILSKALRFLGRFEFVDSSPIFVDANIGLREFNALDFGTLIHPISEGKNVVLKCFSNEDSFLNEVRTLVPAPDGCLCIAHNLYLPFLRHQFLNFLSWTQPISKKSGPFRFWTTKLEDHCLKTDDNAFLFLWNNRS